MKVAMVYVPNSAGLRARASTTPPAIVTAVVKIWRTNRCRIPRLANTWTVSPLPLFPANSGSEAESVGVE